MEQIEQLVQECAQAIWNVGQVTAPAQIIGHSVQPGDNGTVVVWIVTRKWQYSQPVGTSYRFVVGRRPDANDCLDVKILEIRLADRNGISDATLNDDCVPGHLLDLCRTMAGEALAVQPEG